MPVSKSNVLLSLDKRHGREDNLMYRQTEGSSRLIKSGVKNERLRIRMKSDSSSYDFRRDFLGQNI